MIISTTANIEFLQKVDMVSCFNGVFEVPTVQNTEEILTILNTLYPQNQLGKDDLPQIVFQDIPIKSLIMIAEMTYLSNTDVPFKERFTKTLNDFGYKN